MNNTDQKRLPAYPKNFLELIDMLRSEKDCEEFLYNLRWGNGFICPLCGNVMERNKLSKLQKPFVICSCCGRRISVTSGTIMHNTHLSLRKWVCAMWYMSTTNTGISANDLQELLGLNRYATVLDMQKKIRSAMVRLNREKLRNGVEVDIVSALDTIDITNSSSDLTKDVILVAVEFQGKSWRRIRFQYYAHSSSNNVLKFINKFVDKEARIQTSDREIFSIIGRSGYKHQVSISEDPEKSGSAPKPRVRIEIDRVRRWLSTTHHGRVSLKYLQSYLEEYAFRHNRRLHEDIGHTFIRLVLHSVNIHHQLDMSKFD